MKDENKEHEMQMLAAINIIKALRDMYPLGSSERWAIETVLKELKND